MIHPHTELRHISDEMGRGVFATRTIPRGTITWTLCGFDRAFSPAEVAAMPPAYQEIIAEYGYIEAGGSFILCWDHARCHNHACNPTSHAIGNDVEIAVRDILPGELLSCEYGVLNLTADLACRCGAPDCRRVIRGDDALRYGHKWDARVREALPSAARVPQPLWPFVKNQEAVTAVLNGRAEITGHDTYYRPDAAPSLPAVQASGRTRLWGLPAPSQAGTP